jgi:hypothetical protein
MAVLAAMPEALRASLDRALGAPHAAASRSSPGTIPFHGTLPDCGGTLIGPRGRRRDGSFRIEEARWVLM